MAWFELLDSTIGEFSLLQSQMDRERPRRAQEKVLLTKAYMNISTNMRRRRRRGADEDLMKLSVLQNRRTRDEERNKAFYASHAERFSHRKEAAVGSAHRSHSHATVTITPQPKSTLASWFSSLRVRSRSSSMSSVDDSELKDLQPKLEQLIKEREGPDNQLSNSQKRKSIVTKNGKLNAELYKGIEQLREDLNSNSHDMS